MIVKTVGRGQENDIVINDGRVSRVHLQLIHDDQGNTMVVDLGSSNGTFVNGNRIVSETRIKPGDELRIGSTVLNWQKYLPQQTSNIPPKPHTPSPKQTKDSGKRGKPWKFIVVGGLVLLVGSIALLFFNRQDKIKDTQQKQQQEEAEYRELERASLTADRDAARAAAEYEEAMKKAAISKSEEDRRRADSLGIVYKNLQQESKRLAQESNKLKAEKEAADNAKAKAEANERKANELKAKAEKNEQEAKRLKAQAEQKLKDAQDKDKLKDGLYNELNKARNEGRLKAAYESLGHNNTKKEDEQYKVIVKDFDEASDNKKREEIIKKVKHAKEKAKKEEKPEIPEKPKTEPAKQETPINVINTNNAATETVNESSAANDNTQDKETDNKKWWKKK